MPEMSGMWLRVGDLIAVSVAMATETAIKSGTGQARDTPETANLKIDAYITR
jgi:hypothetical protein